MTPFLQRCNQISPLNDLATEEMLQGVRTKTVQKGDYLLHDGAVCRHLFFVEEGLVKSFFRKDDKEFIMRFFEENVLFSVFDSFLTQTPSNYTVMALETTTVTLIPQEHLEILCKKHHCIETFFRKLISVAAIKMTKRISEMLEENASESYAQFVAENGALLQRISLGDLAKYLGITQQSLSRIRNQK